MDFRPRSSYRSILARSSNGLAAGQSTAAAQLHGLCEVIERDAEWLWRASDDSRRLDLRDIHDADCEVLLDAITAAGLYTAVWDVTSDLGIPTYGCVILQSPHSGALRSVGPHDGFACHPDPARALRGALLEAIQKRLTYISGSRDDVSRSEMHRANDPVLIDAVWRQVSAEAPDVRISDRSSLTTGDTTRDLQIVCHALRSRGVEQIIALDLSRSELGVPVWKVIVPGMLGVYNTCEVPELVRPGVRTEATTGGMEK